MDGMFKKHTMRVLILGSESVGKTSIIKQFVDREFSQMYKATIGSDFSSKQVEVGNNFITLQIWDTAGQERYQALASSYYREKDICVLVFDLTSEKSFHEAGDWYNKFRQTVVVEDNYPILLLGNKKDEVDDRVVKQEDAQLFANQHNMLYYEVSAKTGDGIPEAYESVVIKALENQKLLKGFESECVQLPNSKSDSNLAGVCKC